MDTASPARNGLSSAVGALVVVGAAVALQRSRRRHERPARVDKRATLAAYLREHLSGADVAIQTVDRLRSTDTEDGRLFSALFHDFQKEREAVRGLLKRIGASPQSAKRVASRAAATVLKRTAGGEPGELSLFRTLEALAVGVQGKRCMWRALQTLEPALPASADKSFAAFEADAVRQWEALDQRRRSLALETFGSTRPSARTR